MKVEAEAEAVVLPDSKKKMKLRRLPHVFSRVLQLPFPSNAHVSVEKHPHCFRFVAETCALHVEARTLHISPGLTKILIVTETDDAHFSFHDLDLDIWRFRLPESTVPELATAALINGELTVTVPKAEEHACGGGTMIDLLNWF